MEIEQRTRNERFEAMIPEFRSLFSVLDDQQVDCGYSKFNVAIFNPFMERAFLKRVYDTSAFLFSILSYVSY